VECDGIYVSIHVKHPDVFQRKQKLYNDWLKKETLMYYNLYLKPVLIHSAIVIKHNILMRLCAI